MDIYDVIIFGLAGLIMKTLIDSVHDKIMKSFGTHKCNFQYDVSCQRDESLWKETWQPSGLSCVWYFYSLNFYYHAR
jgi:hypothetical protein